MTEQTKQPTQYSTYYLSSLVDGKEEKIGFKVITKDFEKNKSVMVASEIPSNDTQRQFVANFIRISDSKIKDETEIIRSEIAGLFNINIPKVHKIYDEQNQQGVFMNCNLKNGYFPLFHQFSRLNYSVQHGQFKDGFKEYNIPPNKSGEAYSELNTINMIIQKGINAIPTMSITDPEGFEKLKSEYIRMILLDIMLNQITRNGNDYYYYQENKPKNDGTYVSTMHILPGIFNYEFITNDYQENEYCLNEFVVDKNALLNVLFTDYYKYIRDIVKPLRDVSERYKNCISRIVYNNTSKENAEFLENLYSERIDTICKLEQSKVEEGNKVELVSTTTQLNLTIQKKETEILDKYPKNPKEDYENPMLDIDERLSLKAEDSKYDEKRNGYISAALISSVIAFVCGLGMGIAYIILNLS